MGDLLKQTALGGFAALGRRHGGRRRGRRSRGRRLRRTVTITHTRDYLRFFEQAVAESATAEDAKAKLLAAYPDAGLVIASDLGTKVAKGEMTWG